MHCYRPARGWRTCFTTLALVCSLFLLANANTHRDPAGLAWEAKDSALRRHAVVTSLAFDPFDSRHIYVATAGPDGLWISEDGGSSGYPAKSEMAGHAVYAVFTDPTWPGQVLAGTESGLLGSTDAGRTWRQEPGVPASPVYTLARDAAGNLYAGAEGPALYRRSLGLGAGSPSTGSGGSGTPSTGSGTAGGSWELVPALATAVEGARPAESAEGRAVLALAASPAGAPDNGVLLAGTDGAGVFRSADGGRTWQGTEGTGNGYVAALAFLGADGRRALARTPARLYGSTDGGATWQRTASTSTVKGRIDALGVFGSEGSVYIGTGEGMLYHGLFEDQGAALGASPGAATAAGSAASSAAGGSPSAWQAWGAGLGSSGVFNTLQAAPGAPSRWYAGTETGLYLSDDGGLSWRLAPQGPGRTSAQALAVAPDGSLFLGNSDGVYRSTDIGDHWEPRSSGLPRDTVLAIAGSPAAPGLLYAGLFGGGLYRSEDNGLNWKVTGWTKRGVPALLVDPRDPQHLYLRAMYERIYESSDGSRTWTARWTGFSLSTQVISLAAPWGQPGVIYAGAAEGFYESQDGGANWQTAGPELAGQTVYFLAVNEHDDRLLYAGATNGAFVSRDGGQHWATWGHGLEGVTVTAVAFDSLRPERVYAGTKYQGVYRSADGGETWQAVGPEPTSVNALLTTSDGRWLLAATERGFYRALLSTP